MTITSSSTALRWFGRVVWLGILANCSLAVPTLFAPAAMLRLSQLPPAEPLLWPQFAALLLILLSIFYAPAAVDPVRYRATAWSAVGSRLAGVIFFGLFQPAAYRMMGMFDLLFLVPEGVLLTIAQRAGALSDPQKGAAR